MLTITAYSYETVFNAALDLAAATAKNFDFEPIEGSSEMLDVVRYRLKDGGSRTFVIEATHTTIVGPSNAYFLYVGFTDVVTLLNRVQELAIENRSVGAVVDIYKIIKQLTTSDNYKEVFYFNNLCKYADEQSQTCKNEERRAAWEEYMQWMDEQLQAGNSKAFHRFEEKLYSLKLHLPQINDIVGPSQDSLLHHLYFAEFVVKYASDEYFQDRLDRGYVTSYDRKRLRGET